MKGMKTIEKYPLQLHIEIGEKKERKKEMTSRNNDKMHAEIPKDWRATIQVSEPENETEKKRWTHFSGKIFLSNLHAERSTEWMGQPVK